MKISAFSLLALSSIAWNGLVDAMGCPHSFLKGGEGGEAVASIANPHLTNSSLRRKLAATDLSQADFETGTYRIKESGKYKLTEDIVFEPQEANDYWPPFDLWDEYPPSAYYLGFFAAITVEADDVDIDLNGFEIRQSDEFYLLQRFWNAIELNNRVFVQNEGVASLNYQETDAPAGGMDSAGPLFAPKNVVIKNGRIGKSSHAGIHGNSVVGLTIKDVHISGFEVAGIQCNGCKDVLIKTSEIGPSARNVPVLATFSNSRFIQFFTDRLIPFGFGNEPEALKDQLLALFQDSITFGDRPEDPIALEDVFERNSKAVELFRMHHLGEDISDLSDDDKEILEEAKLLFTNRFGLADGSVQYGILINRRGVPTQDDNFVGAGRESENIQIKNVQIHGLHANPIEVPSLTTDEGAHMQGVARDLLRITDIVSDRLRTVLDSKYKGNLLSDCYFALWKMSNAFYRLRVFDSDCGNFGSNASMPLNLVSYPSEEEPTCADLGTSTDPSLTGRDVTMLQKQYFGGLQLSQGVYDWATTPFKGLEDVLARPSRHDIQRSGAHHTIVCDHDTMFHPMHGVVALKIVEAKDVLVKNVEIYDLKNSADVQIWTCGYLHPWQLSSGEDVRAATAATDSRQSAMIRGIEVIRSDIVEINSVNIDDLASDEGQSIAIDVIGDGNDRSDHDDDTGISFKSVTVNNLSGPGGGVGLKGSGTPVTTPNGLTIGKPEEIHNGLGNPRMIMNYQITNARSPRQSNEKIPSLTFTSEDVLIAMMRTTTLDTLEKIRVYRMRVLDFYREHYGMRFPDDVDDIPLLDEIPVLTIDGQPTDSKVQLGQLSLDTEYHTTEICISNGDNSVEECSDTFVGLVHDFAFNFFPGESGYTFYGAFGGDAGKFCPANNIIWVGIYAFERIRIDGVELLEDANLQVEYYGECPTPVIKFYNEIVGFYINCAVESDIFGKGMASGAYFFHPSEDGTEWILNGYPSMIFDDQVNFPVKSTVETFIFDPEIKNIETNDWRFSFIADGMLPTLQSGVEAVAFGHGHHFTHEAGIEYLMKRTSYNTDDKIHALRKKFLSRLKNDFQINLEPDDYDDIPLDGVIDLGGGNKIMAYVVNEVVNQRIMTKRGPLGVQEPALMPSGSRLHEGGFRFVVGRAGIQTEFDRIPFGSVWTEGVYLLEDSLDEDLEIDFYSNGPAILNGWATTIVWQNLYNEKLGDGKLYGIFPLPETREGGLLLLVRGVLVFGNLESPDGLPVVPFVPDDLRDDEVEIR
ncbi:MAG: hypothetical protein SGILL_005072 [Bacillariaceae sp.]